MVSIEEIDKLARETRALTDLLHQETAMLEGETARISALPALRQDCSEQRRPAKILQGPWTQAPEPG